jgi:hypothetical protein
LEEQPNWGLIRGSGGKLPGGLLLCVLFLFLGLATRNQSTALPLSASIQVGDEWKSTPPSALVFWIIITFAFNLCRLCCKDRDPLHLFDPNSSCCSVHPVRYFNLVPPECSCFCSHFLSMALDRYRPMFEFP